MIFKDRIHAGVMLAEKLMAYRNKKGAYILALPRGGLPVGFEIAKKLCLPLDVILVRKLGIPGHEEFAMGAIANNDILILDKEIIAHLSIPIEQINAVVKKEKQELARRYKLYCCGTAKNFKNKICILVDDGLATGATMLAGIAALKKSNPKKIIVAVPVGEAKILEKMARQVDEVICLFTPDSLYSVSRWYESFPQTTDKEVKALLEQAKGFPSYVNIIQ